MMARMNKYMACPVVLIASAIAQVNAQAAEDNRLEEVLVTAQKRSQSIREIPISISAMTSEELARSHARNFVDLTKTVPGLYINSSIDGLGQSIMIRGVGGQAFVSGLPPAVTAVVNDIPLGRLDSLFSNLSDVERIEVLRGPQSSLYGKEASSGVIAITTKKPNLQETEGELKAEFGSNSLQEYHGRVNIPLSDRAAVAVSGYYTEEEGEIENILTGDETAHQNIGGRISFLFQPSESLEVLARYSTAHQEVRDEIRERVSYGEYSLSRPPGVINLPADPFDEKNEVLLPNGRNVETDNASLHISWGINESWNLTSITGYTLFDRAMTKGAPFPEDVPTLGGVGPVIAAGTPTAGDGAFTSYLLTPYYAQGSPKDEETKTQEFRLNYDSETWSSLYGAYYGNIQESADTSLFLANIAGGLPLLLASDTEVTDWSVFTHQIYHASSKWDLVFGLRYGETEKTTFGQNTPLGGFFGDGTYPRDLKQNGTWDNVSGSLKAVYFMNSNVNFYGGVSSGYKPGGFNDTEDLPEFKEETTVNYEVGMKGLFLENRLRLSAAMFLQQYDDFQVQSFDPQFGDTANLYNNAAEVEVAGAELEFSWLFHQNFVLDGALSYVDAEFKSFENADCNDTQLVALRDASEGDTVMGCTLINAEEGIATQDLSGERLFQNSPLTVNLSIRYEADLTSSLNVYVRGGLAYRDDYYGYNTLEPLTHQGSYTLYDASVGLRTSDDRWSLEAYGKNLTDEDYVAGFLPGRDGLQGVVAIKGLGATYGISAKYRF